MEVNILSLPVLGIGCIVLDRAKSLELKPPVNKINHIYATRKNSKFIFRNSNIFK